LGGVEGHCPKSKANHVRPDHKDQRRTYIRQPVICGALVRSGPLSATLGGAARPGGIRPNRVARGLGTRLAIDSRRAFRLNKSVTTHAQADFAPVRPNAGRRGFCSRSSFDGCPIPASFLGARGNFAGGRNGRQWYPHPLDPDWKWKEFTGRVERANSGRLKRLVMSSIAKANRVVGRFGFPVRQPGGKEILLGIGSMRMRMQRLDEAIFESLNEGPGARVAISRP
jgi:hypothetical protein